MRTSHKANFSRIGPSGDEIWQLPVPKVQVWNGWTWPSGFFAYMSPIRVDSVVFGLTRTDCTFFWPMILQRSAFWFLIRSGLGFSMSGLFMLQQCMVSHTRQLSLTYCACFLSFYYYTWAIDCPKCLKIILWVLEFIISQAGYILYDWNLVCGWVFYF